MDMHGNDDRSPNESKPKLTNDSREKARPSLPPLSELEQQIQAIEELMSSRRPSRDVSNQVSRQLFGDSSRVGITQGQGSGVTMDPQNIIQRDIQPSYGPPERKDKKGLNLMRRRGLPLSDQQFMQVLQTQNEQKFLFQLGAVGFSFQEVTCHHLSSISESFFSCDFSTDGNILACAGHGGKVTVWKKEYSNFVTTAVTHTDFISKVRFCPGSIIFATSSYDGTVQLWNAANPTSIIPFSVLKGGTARIMSLDFHPIYPDIICWCDENDFIQLWNICNHGIFLKCFKGGTRQVRFQPQFGKLLATASGMFINMFETDTYQIQNQLQGHSRDVLFICWHQTGNLIASLSEDEACIWSASSDGNLLYVLRCEHGKFDSCIFHPRYPDLLVIGGRKYLQFWISTTGQTLSIPQDGDITGLATSPQNQLVASVSYGCVKLWKCSSC